MKKLLYVTGSRAEYGIMKRLLKLLDNDCNIDLHIVATGMHCDINYGLTYKNIEADGFTIDKLINIEINTKDNATITNSMANCLREFGDYFNEHKFDAILILGDRYEIYSVATAAAIFNIPIIHLHGGEQTLANYDEFIRHAITKMSKLHLASTEVYKNRIIQMGEYPGMVFNIGSLGAENSLLLNLPSKNNLQEKIGFLDKQYFLVLFHPETLSLDSVSNQIEQLLMAITVFAKKYDFIFIGSNADTGSDHIRKSIQDYCHRYKFRYLESVSTEEYLALNKYSLGLIGNSSSGLIEIPSLHIPTINIGNRQKGRVHGVSIINCICEKNSIINSINDSQKLNLSNYSLSEINPYFKENAASNALIIIRKFLNENISLPKKFHDIN